MPVELVVGVWQPKPDVFTGNTDLARLTSAGGWLFLSPNPASATDNLGSSTTDKYAALQAQWQGTYLEFLATCKNIANPTLEAYARAKIYNDLFDDAKAEAIPTNKVSWTKLYEWLPAGSPAQETTFYVKIELYGEYANRGDCDNDGFPTGKARAKATYDGNVTAGPTDGTGANAIGRSFYGNWDVENNEDEKFMTLTGDAGWSSSEGWSAGVGFSTDIGDDIDYWDGSNNESKTVRGNCSNAALSGNELEGYCTVDMSADALAQTWSHADYAEAVAYAKVNTFSFSLSYVP